MAVDDSEASGSLADVGSTETSSRDDVAAAFDAVEAREQAAVPAEKPEQADAAPDAQRDGRDAAGRFTPKRDTEDAPASRILPKALSEATPAQATPAGAQPVASDAPQVPPRLAKAPASWSPAEAANWEKAPAEMREAVLRRESEMQRTMQESAQARQGLATLQQAIAPYNQNIQAGYGGNVVGAFTTFLDFDNRMRHGSPAEKSDAMAAAIKNFGIDIALLDSALAGVAKSPEQMQQDMIRAAIAREVGPLHQKLTHYEQYVEQQKEAAARQELEAFIKTAPPHLNIVYRDMANIIEMDRQQKREGEPKMSLQEAHERACWQNPEVRNILRAGEQSAGAQAQHQAAQRARAAAVGVRNAPRAGAPGNGATPPEQRSRADDIAAAFAHHAGEV